MKTESWNEYTKSEKPILSIFDKLGYKVFDINAKHEDIPEREKETEVILKSNLKRAIKRINPWINDYNLKKAVDKINPDKILAHDLIEANELIYEKLVNYISLEQDLGQGKKNQTVKYIDFENPENNEWMVLNQFKVEGTEENIIPDITIFVNGLPVGVIECKSPFIDDSQEKAIEQLLRYQNQRDTQDIVEGAEKLFYPNQITIAAWGDSASAAVIGASHEHYREWKDLYPYDEENIEKLLDKDSLNNQDKLIFSMFEKSRLLELIRNFTVFKKGHGSTTKIMARYQQYRATKKAYNKIKNKKDPEKRSGTVWHTQGSGKSYTMLFLSLLIKRDDELKNSAMLIVTDRVDLDEQITKTFVRSGFPNPENADSIDDLKDKLRNAAGKTITTTVHKFQESGDKIFPVLTKNKNIFVLVDEAHRTQYKELAANMRRALPNATYIGFTGTPIDKKTRSTLKTFGDYIDTYTITQSENDGVTRPIFYESRLAHLNVEKNIDDLFERIFKDKTEEEKAKIKEKHASPRVLAETRQRIKKIVLDITDHYENKIEPFKAQVVTVSKLAAATYKEFFDEYSDYESAVILSEGSNNEEEIIKKYNHYYKNKEKYIAKFKDENDPLKFLIVCDMLLTGFDAPYEQVMYLDKPLKEHNLLQAIARVNRVYEDKNYGLIVDYYGVFRYLKEALEIFRDEDIKGAVTEIKNAIPKLESKHNKIMKFFRDIDMNNLEECIKAFKDEEKRIKFKNAYREFAKYMDIVLPDPQALKYKSDLNRLGKVFKAVKNHYREALNIRGAGKKVRKLIDEHVRATDIELLNDPVPIIDKDFDKRIQKIDDEEVKASEMEQAIKKEISVRIDENPVYFESLKEKLERLIKEKEEERLQFDFDEYMDELNEIIEQIRNIDKMTQKMGMDKNEFAVYELLLKNKEIEKRESRDKTDKVAEPVTYDLNTDFDKDPYVNKEFRDLAKKLLGIIKNMKTVDWKWKENTVIKNMRKNIKIELVKHEEFKKNYEEITNQIINIAKSIF
ncbi:MAG: type I restriction endonuclease subunit R [Candidatus Mcinerneyibacterium aminivorans]|uniref:Type I restriction enzyme endonuclease subunit n=1 Tax=Candidatus Mcinerneyibacterium aminivorans TaxID=2703815 RepID=A0A5D0MGL2_9BACT|nr:MAG: type I restriction endonuclease subunit R [Candidatus Mcinerneyibacterium aminivorans]